jgi:hypothetical protein
VSEGNAASEGRVFSEQDIALYNLYMTVRMHSISPAVLELAHEALIAAGMAAPRPRDYVDFDDPDDVRAYAGHTGSALVRTREEADTVRRKLREVYDFPYGSHYEVYADRNAWRVTWRIGNLGS